MRSEWARLKSKGVASVWALASQDSSHVGKAGVGVVSLRGASLSLPTSATVQFKRFFDCGRVVRCTLPLGAGRFMHLVVLYGGQGADSDPDQLALSDQLFDAALGELSVVVRGQPCLLVGDFNVEPAKIPCLSKGISAGLWVGLEGSWALAAGKQRSSTCMREWGSSGGTRRDFMIGCPLSAASVLSCMVQADRWISPHLALRALFDYDRWSCCVTQPVRFSLLWPASWLPAVDKSRGSKSVEVWRVWEVYDCRLQFMSRQDVLLLSESMDVGDVSQAWLVWSRAAETALANAYCFSGGLALCQGLVLGRGEARFWRVRLGGHQVRKVRCNAVDVHDAADVFLYRDSSISPLLDMRRRFKAVMDVLDAMIRYGISLARSVELTAQWPPYPVSFDDLHAVQGLGLGDFFRIVSGIHRRLGDFMHSIVVHRRDEAIRVWRSWLREDPLVHPHKWLRPDLILPAPFLADPDRIDEEFRKAWLPYFCRSGQRDTIFEEFSFEVEGWLPLLPVFELPRLTGQMLAGVVFHKSATAGSLDGWRWRELKVLLVSWFDELARILSLVEDTGGWPDGFLDAYIAMIPKADGDATPLGQRPLSVFPVVYRVWGFYSYDAA